MNYVAKVSCKEIIRYNEGSGKKVVLVDCGVKHNIIRCLINRGVEVIRVPWNYDFNDMEFDGLFLANGPGDPDTCVEAVETYESSCPTRTSALAWESAWVTNSSQRQQAHPYTN